MGKNKEKNKVIFDWLQDQFHLCAELKTISEYSAGRFFIVCFISFGFGCFEDILAIFVGRRWTKGTCLTLSEPFLHFTSCEQTTLLYGNLRKPSASVFSLPHMCLISFSFLSVNPLLIISLPLTFNSASSVSICILRSCKLLLSDFWHWPAASIIYPKFSNRTFQYTTAHISIAFSFPSPQLWFNL